VADKEKRRGYKMIAGESSLKKSTRRRRVPLTFEKRKKKWIQRGRKKGAIS